MFTSILGKPSEATRDFCKSLLILKEFINRYMSEKVILAAGFAATLVCGAVKAKGYGLHNWHMQLMMTASTDTVVGRGAYCAGRHCLKGSQAMVKISMFPTSVSNLRRR